MTTTEAVSETFDAPVNDPPASGPSPRAAFTARLKDYAEVHPELSAGEVARIVTSHLLEDDQSFVEEFFIHEGALILAWDLRSEYVQDRRGIYRIVDIAKAGEPHLDKMPQKKRESIFDKISQWREYDPLSNQGQLFISFNKPMLLKSASRDAGLAQLHGWKSAFKIDVAALLPDDTATVGEYFTPDQLLALMATTKQTIAQEIAKGTLRIKIRPEEKLSIDKSITEPEFIEPEFMLGEAQ